MGNALYSGDGKTLYRIPLPGTAVQGYMPLGEYRDFFRRMGAFLDGRVFSAALTSKKDTESRGGREQAAGPDEKAVRSCPWVVPQAFPATHRDRMRERGS